jgi:adenine-specific DNA-methyltransferase
MDLCDVDKSVILTSLILALDKVDSTIGHFSSYLHDFSPRSSNDLKLELPNRFKVKTNNRVIRDDIFNTLSAYKFDLVYFDPPYGSNNEKMPSSRVRYNSYYHFWTTVILNDKPITFGKAGRREDSRDMINSSVFEDKDKNVVLNSIRDLIEKSQCKYVMLSYSSEGRISKENIIDIINKYTRDNIVYEIDYRRNVMSRMKWTNEWIKNESRLNKEYIFLARK